MNIKQKIIVKFADEVCGTYVVSVKFGDKEFFVNSQARVNSSYKETAELTANNESGSDITESGLTAFLETLGIDQDSDAYADIQKEIEECAELHSPENSVLRIINERENDVFTHKKSLFGAFGPTDVHHEKYTSDDGVIIVTSEDTSQPKAENRLLGYKIFNAEGDFEAWKDEVYDDGHYGDCSVSYRAWQDIVGEE